MSESTVIDGRWRILELVGAGGGGRVYRVEDVRSGTLAALKLLRVTTAMHRVRVRREIQTLRSITAPGVVELLDVGEHLDEPYMVMEFVTGSPFPGREAGSNWQAIAEVGAKLCETLVAVHGASVVHRDLKPDNVLVSAEGRVTVLDFGLAFNGDTEANATSADGVVGTPRFLAPEQLVGSRVDARADLFAVGVMLWEALAQRELFDEALSLARLARRVAPEPERLEHFAPHVPDGLVRLVHQLLATQPHDRPASALEVLRVLRGVVSGAGPAAAVELPLVGRSEALGVLVQASHAGRSADVFGPPGVGCSRLLRAAAEALTARGHATFWAGRGQRALDSLVPLLGPASSSAGAMAEMGEALAARLGEGLVVLVDDPAVLDPASRRLLERARARGAVLRIADTPEAVRLGPLPAAPLRALFHGPERVFHIPEDAAAELYARTQGLPSRIAQELDAWVTTRLAAWEGGRLRLSRDAVERLRGGLRFDTGAPNLRAAATDVPGHLAELLTWLALGLAPMEAATLAEAAGVAEWEVELELEELEAVGAVSRRPDGRYEIEAVPASVWQLDEEEAQRRHAALAAAYGRGHPARLQHLLVVGNAGEAVAEAVLQAGVLEASGRPGQGFAVLLVAWQSLRKELTASLRRTLGGELARFAVASGEPAHTRSALSSFREAQVAEIASEPGELAPFVALFEALTLAERGKPDEGWSVAKGLPAFADPTLHTRVQALRVQAALERGTEAVGPLLASLAEDARLPPARVAAWRGMAAYFAADADTAAQEHTLAVSLTSDPTQRVRALVNAVVAGAEGNDPAAVLPLAEELVARGAALRSPRIEAWGHGMLRMIDYRLGHPLGADPEWVQLSAALGPARRHASALCLEAAIAWRDGREEEGRALALASAQMAEEAAGPTFACLPRALWLALGGGTQAEAARTLRLALEVPFPRLALQALWLLEQRLGPSQEATVRIAALAATLAPPCRSARWEVVAVGEVRGG